MKIQVVETRVYEVPEDLESELQGALQVGDAEYIERQLLPAVEHRGTICGERVQVFEVEE